MADHNKLGKAGEEAALGFLRKKGHEILETNFRFSRDEIDIISQFGDFIVFTEVKTRSNYGGGFPELAVSKQKQKRMAKVAQYFLEQRKIEGEIRYDIIAIVKGYPIHHIEDAFFPIN